MTSGALERVIRRAGTRRQQEAAPGCDLCALPLADEHRHLLDTEREELLCACYACCVLFDRAAASEGHYKLVPQRRLPLPAVSPSALGVPVGLAFFVVRESGVFAHYPSPGGATQWEVDGPAWAGVVAACPPLADLQPDVEALLVNTTRGRREGWLVPIDDCHRLVAVVRQHWRGLSGGDRVWPEVERFFDGLRRQHGSDPGR